MRRTRISVALSLSLSLALPLAAKDTPAVPAVTAGDKAIPRSIDAKAIPQYQVVGDTLAVGGQPSKETLVKLKELGFKTVITLRPESEGPANEQGLVEKQGLSFVRVPITAGGLSAADADAVAAVLDDPDRAPVLLHCGSSNRVGGVLAVLEARKGKSADDALAEGKRLGLASPDTIEAVRKVIASEKK